MERGYISVYSGPSGAPKMTISVPALGQTVPVKQSSTYRITSATPGAR